MEVVSWPGQGRPAVKRSVATLGVFDGVHLGHQAVLARVNTEARKRSCRSVIVTFDRHPDAVVRGFPAPMITSLEHRLHLFGGLGVGLCVVIRFTPEVATVRAADFVREVFHDFLGAELLVLGFDCRFGHRREGDDALCRSLGRELGFQVCSVPPVYAAGEPVHSTAVRKAVRQGDFERAGALLGRPFSLYGTVTRGDGRGRAIGFPTANLNLHHEVLPPDGVYACRVLGLGLPAMGLVSIGRRETFHRGENAPRVVEVHVLDVEGDFYGRDVEVRFVAWLRDQIAFEGIAPLTARIRQDIAEARALPTPPPGPNADDMG